MFKYNTSSVSYVHQSYHNQSFVLKVSEKEAKFNLKLSLKIRCYHCVKSFKHKLSLIHISQYLERYAAWTIACKLYTHWVYLEIQDSIQVYFSQVFLVA